VRDDGDQADKIDDTNEPIPVTKDQIRFVTHDPQPVVPPRELNAWERTIVDRLLSAPFPGRQAALGQAATLRVDAECPRCPSVWFRTEAAPDELILSGGERYWGIAPCEFHGRDLDGVPYQILLHIEDGLLAWIDAFRFGPEPFLQRPDLATADVVCA